MKPGNIPHKIIEPIACHLPCCIQINAVKAFHNIRVIGNLKIRHYRISEFLNLYILAVILAYRHAGINDIGNGHHDL